MKMIPVVLLLSLAANFAGAQKLSDDAKYHVLSKAVALNAKIAAVQLRQNALCIKDADCKKDLDEAIAEQAVYNETVAKEIKLANLPAGTTLNPDQAKMDVVVTIPKAEKKSEASK